MQKEHGLYGGTFSNKEIDLTGREVIGCAFYKCSLRLDEFKAPIEAAFSQCKFVGEGWKDFSAYVKVAAFPTD